MHRGKKKGQNKSNATRIPLTHSHVKKTPISKDKIGVEKEVVKKEEIEVQAESGTVNKKRNTESKKFDRKEELEKEPKTKVSQPVDGTELITINEKEESGFQTKSAKVHEKGDAELKIISMEDVHESKTVTTDDQTISYTGSAALIKIKGNVCQTKPVKVNKNEETMVQKELLENDTPADKNATEGQAESTIIDQNDDHIESAAEAPFDKNGIDDTGRLKKEMETKIDQPENTSELTTVDKKEEIIVQTELSVVNQKKNAESETEYEKDGLNSENERMVTETIDNKPVTVDKNEEKESIGNTLIDKNETVDPTESAMVYQNKDCIESAAEASIIKNVIDHEDRLDTELETKLNQPIDGTELPTVDKNGEIVFQTEPGTVNENGNDQSEKICNKKELKSNTEKIENQTVDETELATVSKNAEEESLENTLMNKNITVVSTKPAVVDQIEVSVDRVKSPAKVSDSKNEIENVDGLKRELGKKLNQPSDGNELTIIDKKEGSIFQTKSVAVNKKGDAESKMIDRKDELKRETVTRDDQNIGNTGLPVVVEKNENVCQTKPVTVYENEEPMVREGSKNESLKNDTPADKEATVGRIELAMVDPNEVMADRADKESAEAPMNENEINDKDVLGKELETNVDRLENCIKLTTYDNIEGINKHTEPAIVDQKGNAESEMKIEKEELESEIRTMANQTVDDNKSATVGKNKDKESLQNALTEKNKTVALTESAMNEVSAERTELAAFEENTELGQVTKKIPGIFDSETDGHKLQRDFTSREENIALAYILSMLSLLWPNLSTPAKNTLIGFMKNDNAQVPPAYSKSELKTQNVNNDVKQASVNENESGLEKKSKTEVYQPVDFCEMMTIDKKEESGIQTKSVTADEKGHADSKTMVFKDKVEREMVTIGNKTVCNTDSADVVKKKVDICQAKLVTVNKNEETMAREAGKTESLENETPADKGATVGQTELAMDDQTDILAVHMESAAKAANNKNKTVDRDRLEKESETKVDQPGDDTALTAVDEKEEIGETKSCLPFLVNSCHITGNKTIADEKELDLHELREWCLIKSLNTNQSGHINPISTQDFHDLREWCLIKSLITSQKGQINPKSTQEQTHEYEHDRRSTSQVTDNKKLDHPVYETLRFHSVHGRNIVLSCSNFMAQRVKAANFLSQGIVFSCRPVRINEKICLRMENLSDYKFGVITFGFTNIDPKTLIENVPDSATIDLNKLPGFWAHRLEKSCCEKNNILNYQVNKSGDVLYGINNVKKGILYWGIDTSKPVWGFIDIIGYFTALKFTSMKEDKKPSIIVPLPRLKYQIHFQPFVPLKLHVLEGDNIDLLSFKGVVTKSGNKISKGYIFSKYPVRPEQTIVIQILSTGPEAEFLPLGLTSCDPSNLSLSELPDDAENLSDNSEYCLVYKNVSNCLENGDELAIALTRKGEIELTRNDNEPVTVKQVKKSEKFWAFVQIYGTIETIRIWSTVRVPPQNRYLVK